MGVSAIDWRGGGCVTEWFRLACTRSVVRRAFKYGIGVGTLLLVINHGEAIVRRDISLVRLCRMALTMTVPYMVATASSVSALREHGPVNRP
jgi:hypothetical protein